MHELEDPKSQAYAKGAGVVAFALLLLVRYVIRVRVVGYKGSMVPEHTEEEGCRLFYTRISTSPNATTSLSPLNLWSPSPTPELNNCVSALKACNTHNRVQRSLHLH